MTDRLRIAHLRIAPQWAILRWAILRVITYEMLWLTTQNKVFMCPLPIYIITELGAMSPGDPFLN